MNHGLSQDGGSGRTIAGDVVGLVGDFIDELGTGILFLVLKFDLTGDGDTIVDDLRRSISGIQGDISAFWTQSEFDGVG